MTGRVTVLTGGVGGAKLVAGLTQAIEPRRLTAIVNTGDDFRYLGLHVSPDIDTLLYTLSGLAHPERGWGRKDESWNFLEVVGALDGEQWFRLGDRDLALHVLRTEALSQGAALSQIVGKFARSLGIEVDIVPMSDDPVRTMIETDEGLLAFQHYFVRRRCEPRVRHIRFDGADKAGPAPGVLDAFADPGVDAILIAPSNPFLSIDPILAVPSIRDALATAPAPVVAVSPLVGGQAVKGPTTKIMEELGLPISAGAVCRHYGRLLDGIIIDERDPVEEIDLPFCRMDTLMKDRADRLRVARATLEFAHRLSR